MGPVPRLRVRLELKELGCFGEPGEARLRGALAGGEMEAEARHVGRTDREGLQP